MHTNALLDIKRLYYDPAALQYKRGLEVFEKYKQNAELIEVDGHWKIESLNLNPDMVRDWNQVKAHFLVLGVKNSIASRPNNRSTDWIAPSHSSGCAMACSYCLPAGTMIETPSGAIPIEQIQDGDLVLAYDRSSERLVEARISGVASRVVEEVIEIEVDGVTLQLSPEHPVMTRRGWIEAQHLLCDDEILCDRASLEQYRSNSPIYNLEMP
jgi:hypothetical protein